MTVAGSDSATWFSEPSRAYHTFANRGELVTDWLKRSTVPRAREARRFLNENLAKVPQDHQLVLYRALHVRWDSAFSELIVARTLQLLGGDIEAESESEAGTRIDFRACFADGEVGVEVVSPVFDPDDGEVMKRRSSMLEIIESLTPPRWRIMVDSLPDLGPSDSKRGFKAAVQRLLDTEPPEPAAGLKRVETQLAEGKLRLGILPKRTSGVEGRVIMSEPAIAAWNASEEKIRKAIKKKRPQGRNVEIPSILAVYANGISTTFEDFDHALYGREASVLGTETPTGVLDVSGSEFHADGVFNKGDPTWAAVLAFVNVYLGGGVDPVLYLHPRFPGDLPETLTSIERRNFDPVAGSVNMVPSRRPGFMKGLNFVSIRSQSSTGLWSPPAARKAPRRRGHGRQEARERRDRGPNHLPLRSATRIRVRRALLPRGPVW